MKFATTGVVLVFIFVAVFGFVMACKEMDQGHSGSIGAFMSDCVSRGLPMAIHHISAYQAFSSITISSFFNLASLFAVLAFFAYVYLGFVSDLPRVALARISARDRR